jgi:hypothetical protein
LVFNSEDESPASLARRCIEDVWLWAHRCRSADSKQSLQAWCINFDPP